MLNSVVLVGRLTRDVELRYTPNGHAVADFGLAVERPYTNQQGERDVDFVNITVWRKQAENCSRYIGKGRLVAIKGRLQQDRWQNEQGQNRSRVKVVADGVRFLDWPDDERDSGNTDGGQTGDVAPQDMPAGGGIDDDGLPF